MESEKGRGARFDVLMPRVRALPDARTTTEPAPASTGVPGPTGGRILLVEDEPSLRSLASCALESVGYTVEASANGREALERVRVHPDSFDALVTDLVMPELGGVAVAARIKQLRPDLPVLFMTGYAEQTAVGQGALLKNLLSETAAHESRKLRWVLYRM